MIALTIKNFSKRLIQSGLMSCNKLSSILYLIDLRNVISLYTMKILKNTYVYLHDIIQQMYIVIIIIGNI